jgi:hypothetical protein
MIPTLYGTVEEHSDVRYFDIVIEGNTGIAPRFTGIANSGVADVQYNYLKQPGRAKQDLAVSSSVPLGGFFSNTISQVQNLLNQAGKATSAFSDTPPIESGIYTDQTG